jgi:peptidoglycan/xylan/chitin deacetylase (PgdA/CDA1 family)
MRRWPPRRTAVLLALVGLLAFLPGQQASQSATAAPRTIVSLTFDDGHLSHRSTLSMLASRGMVGTYYINSAMVGSSWYYMTWQQIHALAAAGNEIGGHTLHHANLPDTDPVAARREVCVDRQNLLDRGFAPVTSFAYPEAAVNATAESIVRQCGYLTARSAGNLYSDGVCRSCPYAETIPPADAFNLKTPEPTGTSTTLPELKSYVTDAETHGGGWVILNFHGICNNRCTAENSLATGTFTAFLDWLKSREADGTVVRTVGQVIGPPPVPQERSLAAPTQSAPSAPTLSTPAVPTGSPHHVCSGAWRH